MEKITATLTPSDGGKLYIVATPIGNLEDISLRAIRILQEVDAIIAEDTRHSQHLLQRINVKKPLFSLHQHNEHIQTDKLIQALEQGQSFALISDAGTPLIRDPGFLLVQAARKKSIPVIPIPGPCAVVTALSAAGIPCDTFIFGGFLAPKQAARQEELHQFLALSRTVVLYESPHRLENCLHDIAMVYGAEYRFMLVKELTKTYETFLQGTAAELQQWLQVDAQHIKGEFIVLLPPVTAAKNTHQDEAILRLLLQELNTKQAAKVAALLTATPKNELYRMALTIQEE